jgi:hypothetical protein
MNISERQLRTIIQEELISSSINSVVPKEQLSIRRDHRIFKRSYVTGVLGISLTLQETYPYSAAVERQIIHEQMLYENWWGDDWYLFEGAYGELLKTHSAQVLVKKRL